MLVKNQLEYQLCDTAGTFTIKLFSIQGAGLWAVRITQMRKCRRYWLMPSSLCPRSRPSANLSTDQPACATVGHSKHRYGYSPAG